MHVIKPAAFYTRLC